MFIFVYLVCLQRIRRILMHFLIDLYQHIMISVPEQGIWDGVTLSSRESGRVFQLKTIIKAALFCYWTYADVF